MIEGLNGPQGVAVNSKGEMIVWEADTKRLSILSSVGRRVGSFDKIHGFLFETVSGVAVDASDNFMVLDSDTCLLHLFSPEGKELKVPCLLWLVVSFVWLGILDLCISSTV